MPNSLCDVRRPEMEIAADKLAFLRTSKFKEIDFDRIMPDKNHNWLNLAENDFDELLPLANKETNCLPLYRYKDGNREENITDWGLNQFRTHYQDDTITKVDIFHYTYAVLHHPQYREKYALNLKREFPRLPFYEDYKLGNRSALELPKNSTPTVLLITWSR